MLFSAFWGQYASAQSFAHYVKYIMNTAYDIDCELPDGFEDMNVGQDWTNYPYLNHKVQLTKVCPIIQSKNEECILMYSSVYFAPRWENSIYGDRRLYHRVRMHHILMAACGGDTTRTRTERPAYMDKEDEEYKDLHKFDNCITQWPEQKCRDNFNADSVFVFEVPIPENEPYEEKYTHCSVMFITKYDRPFFMLYWFFTDEGFRKKDEYIAALNKRIWYKEGWVFDEFPMTRIVVNKYCK
jgi:hypothetical protein